MLRNWEDYNKIVRSENALDGKDDYQNLHKYRWDTTYIDWKWKKKYEK